MLRFRKITLVTTMLALVLHAFAQGPNNSGTYYQAATGKKGAALNAVQIAEYLIKEGNIG